MFKCNSITNVLDNKSPKSTRYTPLGISDASNIGLYNLEGCVIANPPTSSLDGLIHNPVD